MSDPVSTPCPSCGAAASGNFCAACGARNGARACPACGVAAPAGSRFCTRCGSPLAGMSRRPAEPRLPWLVAGVLTFLTIAAVVHAAGNRGEVAAPDMGNVGSDGSSTVAPTLPGVAPDISGMTPREQFARLSDRIMAAAETGDTTEVIRFWPMAAGAYDNLSASERDVDARYHMATLHLLVGRLPATLALADTIMSASSDNLLGWYLRAVVAEFQGDSAALRAARTAFRMHFAAEMAADRPEYLEHSPLLQSFLEQAAP